MEKRLINIMEPLVMNQIDSMAGSLDCCTCDYCKADIAAIVLNQVPPKYVVTEKGALFSKLSQSTQTETVDLCTKIVQASVIVKAKPRHPMPSV